MRRFEDFREVVMLDYEYHFVGREGSFVGLPVPLCACAYELRSGREYRLWANRANQPGINFWADELAASHPPWAYGRDVLFFSFNAIAEVSCLIALGWPLPSFVLDGLLEYRQWKNGTLDKREKRDLATIMTRHGLPWGEDPAYKKKMQKLILTGGPFDQEQREAIIRYCWTDVHALQLLLPFLQPHLPIDLTLPLLRGRYTLAAAATQVTGIPVDEATWNLFRKHRRQIILEVIGDHPAYNGTSLGPRRFASWLASMNIHGWPLTAAGMPSMRKRVFRSLRTNEAVTNKKLEDFQAIRGVVEQLRKPSFEVVKGRNIYSILPCKAESSRNSTIGCIFTAPSWLRGLIQPRPNTALLYCDYSQEEFYIAAYLSQDPEMLRLYQLGDPYVELGILAKLMPPDASKHTHPKMREVLKTASLAMMYGQAPPSMAQNLGISINAAEDFLSDVRQRFHVAWHWFEMQISGSYARQCAISRWGWRLAVNSQTSRGTLRNFPVQSCGADILRRAHILLFEAGIRVAAPVHDAFLIEVREQDLEQTKRQVLTIMEQAGRDVLGPDSILRAEAHPYFYPNRMIESKGKEAWNRVLEIVNRLEAMQNKPVIEMVALDLLL
jgi:hypothetical protein